MQKKTPGFRICKKCGIEKPCSDYYKEKRTLDGCQAQCKKCANEAACLKGRLKTIANSVNKKPLMTYEEKKEKARLYKEKIKLTKSPEKHRAYLDSQKVYRELNKERAKEYKKQWHQKNKERLNKKSREYSKINSARRKEYLKEYSERRNILRRKRREEDPLHRFKELLRSGVYRAFQSKGWGKNGHSADILGCSFEVAKAHIERQFTKGMTWDKIGSEIHIDHRIPIHSAKNEEEVRLLCHYTNLQPLWKIDNLKKNKVIPQVQIKLTI